MALKEDCAFLFSDILDWGRMAEHTFAISIYGAIVAALGQRSESLQKNVISGAPAVEKDERPATKERMWFLLWS
ncbi:hypothetical protein EYF80_026437 [Liparis tanakae]|uniref:Uncharacterized protein n=1 Tax=Liparis tanakae TaxID=230148 RepID=A0A4Z2HDJ9_9TELE|nr:hypothetical protein EYF80_026437 [Liparis tanakae]